MTEWLLLMLVLKHPFPDDGYMLRTVTMGHYQTKAKCKQEADRLAADDNQGPVICIPNTLP